MQIWREKKANYHQKKTKPIFYTIEYKGKNLPNEMIIFDPRDLEAIFKDNPWSDAFLKWRGSRR